MLLWASINIIGVPSCPSRSETPYKPVDSNDHDQEEQCFVGSV